MIKYDYPKGSEWLKWELHTHSDASDGDGSCNEIVDTAINKKIAVLALTDHHTAKNIDEIKEYAKDKNLEVISGIEFRTEYGAKSVHMIGLFPDKTYDESGNEIVLNTKALTELILNPLDLSETRIIAKGREGKSGLSELKAFKSGIFKVQVDFKEAADLIHKYGGLVVVHAGSKSNSIDQEMKHKGTAAKNVETLYDCLGTVKEGLFKSGYIDICEIKKETDSGEFYLQNFNKPSITASDAHKLEEIGSKAIWIKANPTFEGLRQIMFEPEQRVSFSDIKSDEKNDYQIISKIKYIDANFQIKEIPISNNLTSIIGGKSTGKSILLRTIAKAVDNEEVQNRLTEVGLKDYKQTVSGFEVYWEDGQVDKLHNENGTKKKIIYIPQSYLNRLVDEDEANTSIDDLIKGILSQNEDVSTEFEQLTNDGRDIEKIISNKIDDLFFLLDDIKKLKENISNEGDKKGIEDTIAKLEAEIEQLKKESGLSDEQLDKYKGQKDTERKLRDDLSTNKKDRLRIEKLITQGLVNDVNLEDLSRDRHDLIINKYTSLKTNFDKDWKKFLKDLLSTLDSDDKLKRKSLEELLEELKPFSEILIKQELLSLKLQKLEIEKGKLLRINNLTAKRKKLSDEAVNTISSIVDIHSKYYTNMFEGKENILSRYPQEGDLKFEINIDFKNKSFNNNFVEQYLNLKTLASWKEVLMNPYQYKNPTSLQQELSKIIYGLLKDKIKLKSGFTKKEALRKLLSNWHIYNFSVIHQGDDISQMSPGKKSFVLLKLLIELDESKCPILLDQPEDDLDNRSIFVDLVRFLKTKKLDRQIIIATHNPNVVVGSDSEQIIIANQHGGKTPNIKYKFEYISGSIEHSVLPVAGELTMFKQGIREHVCEILEGGETAFINRQNKYNIN